jgi:predicted dehydrogenase
MKTRIGIIGAGAIAHHHLKVLRALDDVEVVALANRSAERRDAVAKEFDIPTTYEHYIDMLAKEKLDAVYVLTSVDTIYPITKDLIPSGLPLFIEKPAGLTAEETRDLAAQASHTGTRIMVGYNRRFYSVLEASRAEILKRGPMLGLALDAPESIAKVRALGKFSPEVLDHWLVANGTHGLDLLRYLGGEIAEVYATKYSHVEKNGDNFGATIRYANGTIGHYVSHWNTPGRHHLSLYGDGIRARFEPIEQGEILLGDNTHALAPDQIDLDYKPGFYAQARYFIDRVQDSGPIERPACSIEDAVGTMELAERLMQGAPVHH